MAGRRAVVGGLLLALVSGCLGLGNRPEPAPPPPAARTADLAAGAALVRSADEQLYAMTISGGVSLGAYEAGLNWTVVEFMRRHTARQAPHLVGVTGASAGSINALLTAIRWCEARPTTSVEDNLFAGAWLPVGFDTLLPGDSGGYYGGGDEWPQDLLLSRKNAFAGILRTVGQALDARAYRQGCDLKLGFTVTSKSPRVLELRGLNVGNQRFVLPLVATVQDGRLRFAVDTDIQERERKDLLGNLLFLAPSRRDADGSYIVAHRDVVRAALASSAYPVAFGPVDLSYCAPRAECSTDHHDRDPVKMRLCGELAGRLGMEDAVACRGRFIDGGVFDNVPLGVAMAQIESTGAAATHRPLRYIYMYPGNRRDPAGAPPAPAPAESPGTAPAAPVLPAASPLGDTFDFIGGFVDTASEYELHNVLRYNLWNAGTPQLARSVARALGKTLDGADEIGQPLPDDPGEAARQAGEVAARLDHLVAARPIDRAAVADALVDASRVLEQISSQPTAIGPDDRSLYLSAYGDVRSRVLDAALAICGPRPQGGPAERTCGAAGRDLLFQARQLHDDPRNERQLRLSRRFSPIAGTHISHFGAFFDRPLRDYDYYAGIYDALWSVSELACEIDRARRAGVRTYDVKQSAPPSAAPGPRDPVACRRAEFESARARLGITAGVAFEVTERLWHAEHDGARPPADPASPVYQVMTALFDPRRCSESDRPRPVAHPAGGQPMCLRDLDLAAFAKALKRARYRPTGDPPFLRWVMDHPESGWWPLPAVFAVSRLLELSRAERIGKLSMGSALAATYLESYVDQHSTSVFVAPSSLPDRVAAGRWAGLLFPYAALSLHPTRRFELGLARGGIRVGPKEDVSGLATLLPWDLLAEVSARVTVRPRHPDEDDQGYGLFTRGSTTLHASFAPTLRLGGILWSVGLRAGVPVPIGQLESPIPYRDQVNTEVVATFLGDKVRVAAGCHPLQAAPGDDCWRDLYYSFGLNDLAGLAYWTGANPFKLDRLFIPFVAARLSDDPSAEMGLVRGGWQPSRWIGLWGDATLVAGAETTANASLAYEIEVGAWVRRVGLRGGYPLSIRHDARIKAANLELVLTLPHGLRLAAGAFPFDVAKGDVRWYDASYLSLGWDPGSAALAAVRALR